MCRLAKTIALTLALTVFSVGCGMENSAVFIKQQYSLESVQGSGDTQQKVYRAKGESVPDVAKKIAAEHKPDEMSAQSNEHMFLVYPDDLVHVQQDPEQPSDTLVEVDTEQFVRQNYDPSFLSGFLAASMLSNIFGSGWRSYPTRGYNGYGQSPSYRSGGGAFRAPTKLNPGTKPARPAPKSRGGKGRVIRR